MNSSSASRASASCRWTLPRRRRSANSAENGIAEQHDDGVRDALDQLRPAIAGDAADRVDDRLAQRPEQLRGVEVVRCRRQSVDRAAGAGGRLRQEERELSGAQRGRRGQQQTDATAVGRQQRREDRDHGPRLGGDGGAECDACPAGVARQRREQCERAERAGQHLFGVTHRGGPGQHRRQQAGQDDRCAHAARPGKRGEPAIEDVGERRDREHAGDARPRGRCRPGRRPRRRRRR